MKTEIDHIIDDLRLAKEYKQDGDEIGGEILATLEIVQSISDGVEEAVNSLKHLNLESEDDRDRLIRRATSEVIEQISRNTTEG